MILELLPQEYTVCQLTDFQGVDPAVPGTFLACTEEEFSLVCPKDNVPLHVVRREDGWRCLKVAGPLEFSLVGVLAGISACFAAQGISIFALSTYNTDYVLFKKERLKEALAALAAAGYETRGE